MDKVASQLNKRNRERQDQLNAKHELSKQNTAANENLEDFQENFKKRVHSIEENLNNLTSNIDKIKLSQNILRATEDIQNLQDYLTSSTFFLSGYTVKSCQKSINDLQIRIDTIRKELLVKKKFNFRSKIENTPKDAVSVDVVEGAITASPTKHFDAFQINWTIQNQKNKEILLLSDETNDKDIAISSLDKCLIIIRGYPNSLQLSKLIDCVVLCGPIKRSLFADHCENCKFIFGCQQLRLHSSHYCDLYMHVTCRAIIEDCCNINVAPYNYLYENIDDDFANAGLDKSKNNWNDLADFNWLSTDTKSPNWNQLTPDLRITDWNEFLIQYRNKYNLNE